MAESPLPAEPARSDAYGFVSLLGSKGGEKIDSSKNTAGELGVPRFTSTNLLK